MSFTTLTEILNPSRLTEIVDIGPGPNDPDRPYQTMLKGGLALVTGFEPQRDLLNRLLKRKSPAERYLPHAICDGAEHLLHVFAGGPAGFLEPDPAAFELFDALRPSSEIVRSDRVLTKCLDEVSEINRIDLLKVDLHGGELAVIRHGNAKLSGTVAIQVGVPFVGLFKNQPTFGEIDSELRRRNFIPHSFVSVKRWPISPCVVDGDPKRPLNQLLGAEMVYVRDFSKTELFDDEQLKQLALVAHYCYGSYDLALRCIHLLERRGTLFQNSQARYLRSFNAPAAV